MGRLYRAPSWGRKQRGSQGNRYSPGSTKTPLHAHVVCHLGGAPRPSSWELGGCKGLTPGDKGERVPFVPNARHRKAKAKRDAKKAR